MAGQRRGSRIDPWGQWPTLHVQVAYFGQHRGTGTGLFRPLMAWFEIGSGLIGAASKVEIDDPLLTDPLRELGNLGKDPLAFGVFLDGGLRRVVDRFVACRNDQPVSGGWAGFKPAEPISDPVFEVGGLQSPGQGSHYVDGTAAIMGDA